MFVFAVSNGVVLCVLPAHAWHQHVMGCSFVQYMFAVNSLDSSNVDIDTARRSYCYISSPGSIFAGLHDQIAPPSTELCELRIVADLEAARAAQVSDQSISPAVAAFSPVRISFSSGSFDAI